MKISVCLASYNGESYIGDQLTSILGQIGPNDEVIVSDDGSKDLTLSIVKSMQDPRIQIIHHRDTHGYTKNFEHALKHASGDVFFLSDQDDIWLPNKVKLSLAALKSADLVISDAETVDGNLKTIYPSHFEHAKVRKGFWVNFAKTRYIGACMAFNKKVYDKVLPFPQDQRLCVHDYWIGLIGELCFKVKLINVPLIQHRRHGNNVTGEMSTRNFRIQIFARIYTFFHLLRRVLS